MRLNEVFPSKYLKAEDLADGIGGYRRVTVMIRETVMQDLGDERKAIVYFRGKDKGLVLNRTNADELQTITGSDDTDDWNGHRVMIYVERVPFQGKKVPALRICAADDAQAANVAARNAPRAAQAPPQRQPQQPPASLAGGWREAPQRPPTPAAPNPRRHPYQPEPEPEAFADSEPDPQWSGGAEAAADREPGGDDEIPF